MVALGFHSDWLHRIDYMGKAYSEVVLSLSTLWLYN